MSLVSQLTTLATRIATEFKAVRSEITSLEGKTIRSPNYIINGGMDIWQRGTSFAPITNGGYAADRWQAIASVAPASRSVFRNALSGAIPEIEDVSYYLRSSINTIGSGTNPRMRYYVEDVATLAGKTVTLSWYGKNNIAGSYRTLLSQGFGTGGSTAVTVFDTNIAYSTSWQRLSVTFVMPSIVGKTIGTGSYLLIDFFQAATSGNLLDITGIQLEEGDTPTPFRRNANSLQGELAACQRYYWRMNAEAAYGVFGIGASVNTLISSIQIRLPVSMRTIPSTLETSGTPSNYSVTRPGIAGYAATSLSINSPNTSSNLVTLLVNSATLPSAGLPVTLEANGVASAFLGFSAEL